VGERIYLMGPGERLEPLEEEFFGTEDELQALIADHPELLDGEQMRSGDPLRWVLVTREKSISESPGAGGRWSVDHLIVDQDAVPTLVEVKRGENSEIRRNVIGQMLEYAAHAAATWTADELRRSFEESSRERGRDPGEAIADLLGPYEAASADRFWDDVSRNLAASRLRLLFVADEIPEPLKRVAEFLHAQMPGIEVFAVEVKRFRGERVQTLVPRVFGSPASPRSRDRPPRLTRELFLEDFAVEAQRQTAEQLLDAARDAGATFAWGPSGVSVRAACPLWPQPVALAWLYTPSKSQAGLVWMKTRDFSFGTAVLDYGPDEDVSGECHAPPTPEAVTLPRIGRNHASSRSPTGQARCWGPGVRTLRASHPTPDGEHRSHRSGCARGTGRDAIAVVVGACDR